MSEKKTDYVSEGLNRLLSQFDGSVRLRALLSAFLNRVQDFEDAYHPLLAERGLDNATGDRLDIIGQLFKLPRGGRTDTDYRTALQNEILVLTSTGTAEELITIVEAITDVTSVVWQVTEYYPKTFFIRASTNVDNLSSGQAFPAWRTLRRAKPAGTQVFLEYAFKIESILYTLSSQGDVLETSSTTGLANDAQTSGGYMVGVAYE